MSAHLTFAIGRSGSWLFVLAMIAGMWLQRIYADVGDGRKFSLSGAVR